MPAGFVTTVALAAVLSSTLVVGASGLIGPSAKIRYEVYDTDYTGLYERLGPAPDPWGSTPGAHRDYTTTTGQCRDCHAPRRRHGSFRLWRASSSTDACDYCHHGGTGSSANVLMDNVRNVVPGTGDRAEGLGSGHTFGYTGRASLDVKPAYRQTQGFGCFECHTPHGNSERLLATYVDTGRLAQSDFMVTAIFNRRGFVKGFKRPIDLRHYNDSEGTWYGITSVAGNIAWVVDGDGMSEQVWPTGRMLLMRNPDHERTRTGKRISDRSVSAHPGKGGGRGKNKVAIDWTRPIGPGLKSDAFSGMRRLITISEFCTDCHDGAAGISTHKSTVWQPDGYDPSVGAYTVSRGHESDPRQAATRMFLRSSSDPDNIHPESNNYGGQCRRCHAGRSSCGQCHGSDTVAASVYSFETLTSPRDTRRPRKAYRRAYVSEVDAKRQALVGLSSQCVDAGFTWPHRTLAANLLKDQLYGVDFDGESIEAGDARTGQGAIEEIIRLEVSDFADGRTAEPLPAASRGLRAIAQLAGAPSHALDSACIDCHGAATYWNGDNPDYRYPEGWDPYLKGLP